jgi:putative acetyltransferase
MADAVTPQTCRSDDLAAIEVLYQDAFPDEDLVPLVRALLANRDDVLSLVTRDRNGEDVTGHGAFTHCGIVGAEDRVALLGPLAVASARQGQGIGEALIRDGLRRLGEAGVQRVFVLGDPAYYGRFGFTTEPNVRPPHPLPEEWREAWQSISLNETKPSEPGTLSVPAPWRQPALWGP